MSTLCTYRASSGRRGLVFVSVPDEPGLHLLFDAALDGQDGTDVELVDDDLTTLAEARIVAHGWASEHSQLGTLSFAHDWDSRARRSSCGDERELARYATSAGTRLLVGQRIGGEVRVVDRPAGDEGTVLFVARDVSTRAELDALVADYVAECERRGEPARRMPEALLDDLAEALAA